MKDKHRKSIYYHLSVIIYFAEAFDFNTKKTLLGELAIKMKFLSISEKQNLQYEIQFEISGRCKKILINETRSPVADASDFISTLTSSDEEFYQIWKDADFRKTVSAAITELKTSKPIAA